MATEDDLHFGNETVDTNLTYGGWNDTDDGNTTLGGSGGGNATNVVVNISLNFVDSFVKSFSVMIVSELGDKTFFLAGPNDFF